ncbi:MAG TPA: hypothetical protein VGP71_09180 [Burkholderiales bacterium]|nr:hypothetical protein [Burkholderiales bacterium]
MKRIARRLMLTVTACVATAFLSAIALAILDLYLVGHGHAGLMRESISWPAAGVHLSAGDVITLSLASLAAALAWNLSGRRS